MLLKIKEEAINQGISVNTINEELKGTNITLFKNEKVCDIQSILKNNNIIELNI